MKHYYSTYAYKTFPDKILIPLESKPFLSMPVFYFIKRGMFKTAYIALKQNWVLRKHIDWKFNKKNKL